MKRSVFKKVVYVLLIVFIILQFIHPAGNNGEALSQNDITQVVNVPEDVMGMLKTSCFDCHSNHTRYPWYHAMQPIGFWLDNHVEEGKEELNFSEFNTYKPKRQFKKLKKISNEVRKHGMPLSSYLFIHHDAELSEAQIMRLAGWADSASLTIQLPDSLKESKY